MIEPTEEREKHNELAAWTLTLRDRAFVHQHVVDAWGAQHADERSKAISVAFALIGLHLHLERGYTGREVQRVHMQLGQPRGRGPGRKEWPRFQFPKRRPGVTVVDVMAVPESERVAAIDRWCESVWDAWQESQQQVRDWAARELRMPAPAFSPPNERRSPR